MLYLVVYQVFPISSFSKMYIIVFFYSNYMDKHIHQMDGIKSSELFKLFRKPLIDFI